MKIRPAPDGAAAPGGRLAWAAATAALLLTPCCAAPKQPPSLLLVTIDTLRADHLPFYGYARDTAPRLGALARRGVVFTSVLAPAPETGPACASLLTGRRPSELGVRGNGRPLPPGPATLAEILAAAGYDTAAFVSGFPLVRRLSGLDRGFALYDDAMPDPRGRVADVQRAAPRTTDAVLAWLRQRSRARPFFLWVHYYDVHGDYAPPPPYDTLFGTGGSGPMLPLEKIPEYQRHGIETDASAYIARYDGEIRRVDDQIGRLLDALDSPGGTDGTLIVAMSDHGESLTEHGYYFDHGNELYLPSLHVPLLLAGPGVPAGGAKIGAPAQTPDILPTILELLGRPAAPGVSGRSLAPALRGGGGGGGETWAEARFEPYRALTPGADVGPKLVARDDRFTLLLRLGPDRLEIYDRARDPGEATDLVAGSADGAATAALRAALSRALRRRVEAGTRGAPEAPPIFTPEMRRALEGLAAGSS